MVGVHDGNTYGEYDEAWDLVLPVLGQTLPR